ncbi:MAG TPA: MCE family protein, partial [Phycisphaerae bacterium]|nr:MCE family protein [Phycisphaerae bacterium]
MNEGTKNFAVGATVLVGLAMLISIILIFTGLPGFFSGGYEIKVYLKDTYSIRTGEPIYFRGMKIGSVTDMSFTDGDHTKG